MRVFLTGASGWIGAAVVPELLGAGHEVVGLARSDAAAAAIMAAGAEVFRGSLDDPRVFATEPHSVTASCTWLQPRFFTDGGGRENRSQRHRGHRFGVQRERSTLGRRWRRPRALPRTGRDRERPARARHPSRSASVAYALSLAHSGVRSSCVRFAPTVHGDGDHGFIATLVGIARAKGTSGYVGDGANCWPAVHRLDAARLVRLTLEGAPAGTSVHAVAEPGIATRAIAEAIGSGLGVPVVSIPSDEAGDHFGWMSRFFAMDATASNTITRELLSWEPTHQGLLADLSEGHYFKDSAG